MELYKITTSRESGTRRRYDDACGTAHALELVGDRWALLIVRELMFGPRRFGEVKAALKGISANILTQRLEALEAAGIVRRRKLPPPASVMAYALTPWGQESEDAIKALGRWAARSPGHDPRLPLSAASLMLSFRTMLSAERAAGIDATIAFAVGEERFVARLADGDIVIRRGEAEKAVLTLAAPSAENIAAVVYGGVSLSEAEAAAMLSVEGDRALAARFVTWFPLPEKVAVED